MPSFTQHFNWSLLRVFIIIVQEGSLNRAAIKLNLTQSAVSQSLKKLEEQIGEVLIQRHRNYFALTPAGQLVYEAGNRIYADLFALEERIKQQQTMTTGTLKLLVLSRIQSRRFDKVLYEFHQQYPLVDFQIDVMRSSDIQQLLLQKIPALGICLSTQQHTKLNYQVMIRQKYGLYCGKKHPLFRQEMKEFEQIQQQGFVLFQTNQLSHIYDEHTKIGQHILSHNHILGTTNNIDEVMRFVKNGIGLGFLPSHVIEATADTESFYQLPPYPYIDVIPIYLAWHNDRPLSPPERSFIEALTIAYAKEG